MRRLPPTRPLALQGKDQAFLDKYCSSCHNSTDWAGELALDVLDTRDLGSRRRGLGKGRAQAARRADAAIRASRSPRPPSAARSSSAMEASLDKVAASQRESRVRGAAPAEPPRIHATPSANCWISRSTPKRCCRATTLSDGFDNVAEVLKVSPSFLEQYLSAAREVSVQAIGNPQARLTGRVYPGPPGSAAVREPGRPAAGHARRPVHRSRFPGGWRIRNHHQRPGRRRLCLGRGGPAHADRHRR